MCVESKARQQHGDGGGKLPDPRGDNLPANLTSMALPPGSSHQPSEPSAASAWRVPHAAWDLGAPGQPHR